MTAALTLSRIDAIERTSLYVAGVLCAGSLVFSSLAVTLGVALGALIVVINFRWLRRLVERAIAGGAQKRKKRLYAQYALKFFLFLAVPGAVVYYRRFLLDLDPLGFVVGLSTVFFAICVEGIKGVLDQVR